MAILGAHMSIVGGFEKAVQRARRCGCDCVQLFTKNNSQWLAPPIAPEAARRFHAALARLEVGHPAAHVSYLINLASPNKTLWQKSIDSLAVELRRAETLGIPYVITHPGSYTTSSESRGLRRVVRALDLIHGQTGGLKAQYLLETTAGQGTCLGWRFEQLAVIFDAVRDPERLGVCFDTCHVFAAGYPMTSLGQYRATMRQLERLVGLKQIKAFHLNDSRFACGSRVDRHAHIGQGCMGLAPFRHLLADRRFHGVPMYLETPKSHADNVDLDRVNLATLRGLLTASG
jgi:deoxyribonuclease IV